MARGELDQETLKAIDAKLPDLRPLFRVRAHTPTCVSIVLGPQAKIRAAVAAVCLNDTFDGIAEARFAAHEALACVLWYRERSPKAPNEPAAVFFGRFYLTAAASSLYAAAEHAAEVIIEMLQIDREKLTGTRSRSLQSRVAEYLTNRMPTHVISERVRSLGDSDEWRRAIDLRNRWVHDQPPTMAGHGVVYRRVERWKIVDDGRGGIADELSFGGGDEPEYCLDDVLDFVLRALARFAEFFGALVAEFEALLTRSLGTWATADN